ncbi:MAG: hypothetical protein AAF919_12850 [Pseudomonadota bacterium]
MKRAARTMAVLLCLIVGGIALAQAVDRDPFEVPVQRRGDYGEWDPGRELTFRLEDWRGEETVTGRYAVFSFPIGHTIPWSSGVPDEGSTGWASLRHRMSVDKTGAIEILPQATTKAEWTVGQRGLPFYDTRVSARSPLDGETIRRVMRNAKRRNGPFPGYELTLFRQYAESELHHVGEHCGYDMFESMAYRDWHYRPGPFDLDRPPPPEIEHPFDRARVFGWPSANGITHDFGVICEDSKACIVAARVRPWITMRFRFDREWLCDIPKVVRPHLDWLETRIVAEETEILNPAYQ